jgi:transposase-like protein
MVLGDQAECASQWEAMRSISEKIGCSAEALRSWVRQAEVDARQRGGLPTGVVHDDVGLGGTEGRGEERIGRVDDDRLYGESRSGTD